MDELMSIEMERIVHGLVVDRPDVNAKSVRPPAPSTKDSTVRLAGARRPNSWQLNLADVNDLPAHVTRIPAGLWLRKPGGTDLSDDELCSEAPDQNRMYVVVGAPGEPPPAPEMVADLLRKLPVKTREATVLCWYGSKFAAGAVAEELAAPVRAVHGVPAEGALVFVDEDGVECWRPFAQESVYRPAGPPLLDRWVDPPGLTMVEPGSFGLIDGWRVDVVPRGLLVRPESVHGMPTWGGPTGPTADVVVVSSEGVGVPIEVVIALDDVLRDLPDDTVDCLRLLPVDAAAAEALAISEHVGAVVYDEVDVALPAVVPPESEPEVALEPPHPEAALEPPSLPGLVPSPGTAPTVRKEQPAPSPSPAPIDHPRPPVGAVIVTTDGRVIPAEPIVARSAGLRDVRVSARAVSRTPLPSADTQTQVRSGHEHSGRGDDGSPVVPTVVAPDLSRPAAAVAGLPLPGPATAHSFQQLSPPSARSPEPLADRRAPAARPTVDLAADVAASSAPNVVSPEAEPGVAFAEPVRQQARSVEALGSEPEFLPAHRATVPQLQPPPPAERASQPPAAMAPEVATARTQQAPPEKAEKAEKQPQRPAPAAIRPAKTTAAVEIPEDARSTAEQRRGMRKTLGARYDTAAKAVTRLLSERPGLRFGADDAALLAELAVVRVFADDPAGSYDPDFYVCLADGLRRLPTARAVVVRSIPPKVDVRPETIVRVPVPVLASPAPVAPPAGGSEALIWTTSGRRLDGLLDDVATGKECDQPAGRARRGDIVLSGHTRLRVLAVESDPVQRLLLAEDGVAGEAALTRLRAAATARSVVAAPQPAVDVEPWFRVLADA